MNYKSIAPDKSIALFVKNIMVFEESNSGQETTLPFFADGYPGIMFQDAAGGLFVLPHNKKMPAFFLYGQTIHPIELKMQGSYRLIVFQLYPFVIKSFFGAEPASLNDDCYDLRQLRGFDMSTMISKLQQADDVQQWQLIISGFLQTVFEKKKEGLDFKIHQALSLIIKNKGALPVAEIRKQLAIGERTFERRFIAATGVSPKQFSRMIQFQHSLSEITSADFKKLTDVVYNNGYADQSHFIKVFRAFTGKTPKAFKSRSS